ncbi:hypothetical protein NDI76_06545 [Halogeometricum sp. S1BR25-6]|uniref:DUF7260 domain-containing protein n=1 Tax=Halogeometricum salsisoli TaxID=2950536 RepID=A0ABU2GCC4_9EURY|nr:hypothetical protein [Halogeometricum sp. S1BR25-6]MDS0298394.1 hypothetical protein [Halogeometricum sp. S1BR25-6]
MSRADGDGTPLVGAYLGDATSLVRRERRRCTDERTAFRAFRSAVADVRPTAPPEGSGGPPAAGALSRTGRSASLTAVSREYRRTVMAVPHYESEYGDEYAESVAAEFGEAVAAGLTGGGTLTPPLRGAVVEGATAAMREREEFVSLLAAESSSLASARTTVDDSVDRLRALDNRPLSERSFADLARLRTAVLDVRDGLDEAAARRQETMRSHRRTLSNRAPSVAGYLYADLPVDHPALDALASARSLVETALARVDRRSVAAL